MTSFPRVIDSSIRREFAMCDLRGHYSYMRNLAPVGGNVHLHFGACFAKGLEVVRKSFYGEGKNLLDSLAAGARAIILSWGDFTPPDNSNKTLATCLVALWEYFLQYKPADDPVKPVMIGGQPAVEFTFALPIPEMTHPETGEPLLYGGRFDFLGEYNNARFIVDDKTSSMLGASWAKQWKLDAQPTGYCWAAGEYGYPVQGAIIRGVGILKTSITHQMCLEARPKWMIESWLKQLRRDVQRMIDSWKAGVWDQDLGHSCGTYGGCPFLPLCTSPEPESWIGTLYEEKKWNPLEKI